MLSFPQNSTFRYPRSYSLVTNKMSSWVLLTYRSFSPIKSSNSLWVSILASASVSSLKPFLLQRTRNISIPKDTSAWFTTTLRERLEYSKEEAYVSELFAGKVGFRGLPFFRLADQAHTFIMSLTLENMFFVSESIHQLEKVWGIYPTFFLLSCSWM